MKKYKIMLMLFVLVILSGTAFAAPEVTAWTYTLNTSGDTGTLAGIVVPATLVGGTISDPDVTLMATLPAPVLTANETGRALDAGAIGYYEVGGSCGGFTLQWSGSVDYSVTVNYGEEKTWVMPVPLVFREGDAFDVSADVYDVIATDVIGAFTTASRWGDGCDGHRHTLDALNWAAGLQTGLVDGAGPMSTDADGDDMGVTLYKREGTGTGVIFVSEIRLSGEIVYDLDNLLDPDDPCPASIRDAGDITGPESVPDCVVDDWDLLLMASEWLNCGWDYGCP